MPSEPNFLVLDRDAAAPRAPRPVFLLRKDNWDDFGHKVYFHLSHVGADQQETEIGPLRILQRNSLHSEPIEVAKTTELPPSFSTLDDHFISLGQEETYYRIFSKLDGPQPELVLDALRDIAWHPALANSFEPTPAFRNAMMRQNGAQRARRFGRRWAMGLHVHEDFDFSYAGHIVGADADVETTFAFDAADPIPGRIIGIIGRNAVGKTQFLASLGADLAQTARISKKSLNSRDARFQDRRPLFTRVIAISYSAFDRFKRPPHDKASSYVYCGIRSDKGGISRAALMRSYRTNLERVRNRGEKRLWTSHMRTILGDLSAQLAESLEVEIDQGATDDETFSQLSSGQSILAHFVTALLAWIQPNSVVLFDEPETHLHPNAVASLFLVLSEILSDFDSYAVVATHSPVVIQEIPAKRVLLFQREDSMTTADPLPLESFGESVTELTRHVFETDAVASVYRRTFRKLAHSASAEEVLAQFDRGLSLSAQAYLLAQYGNKGDGTP